MRSHRSVKVQECCLAPAFPPPSPGHSPSSPRFSGAVQLIPMDLRQLERLEVEVRPGQEELMRGCSQIPSPTVWVRDVFLGSSVKA